VTRRDFLAQLGLLSRFGWQTVRISDLQRPDTLPPHAVAITFDDGYADNAFALQALHERGMTATWFVVSNDIGRQASWPDQGAPSRRPLLDVPQLRRMATLGFEIGAHSRRHAHLPRLDDAGLRDEVTGSKEQLETLVGQPVTSFAYPYGEHDDRVVAAAEAAGYLQAVTCMTGWALVNTNLLRIRRIPVFRGDTLSHFARKLVFADSNFGWGHVLRYYWAQTTRRI
jgi:peptidoglycan/xylan/chitin deacetylase (PgdA/CDA1 family)